jgi:hypothetical protein
MSVRRISPRLAVSVVYMIAMFMAIMDASTPPFSITGLRLCLAVPLAGHGRLRSPDGPCLPSTAARAASTGLR